MISSVDSSSSLPRAPMEIVAHRGASYVAPENTRAAYLLAWEMGADAAEVDIHLTRDNRIVASHDSNAKRTTGTDVEIKDSTYEELARLDAGCWKALEYKGEPVPLLSDILETVPPRKSLYIEIKCGPEVLPHLEAVLDKSGKRGQVVLIGFDLDTISQAKKAMPDRPAYWLRGTRKDEATETLLSHDLGWIDLVELHGLDGLDVNYGGVTPHFAEAVRDAGLVLAVWTVNDPEVARRMMRLGVRSLTTDHVDLLEKGF